MADGPSNHAADGWQRLGEPTRWPDDVVDFGKAKVGDEVYTWEVADGHDWGDYLFETEDPAKTGADDMESGLVRKRWRLVEVTEIPSPRAVPDAG